MPSYSFIKIVDNNNPNDFRLDITSMKDYRNRMSSLRTQCLRYLDYNIGRDREIYKYFYLDYSFHVVHRQEFTDLNEARRFKSTLEKQLHSDRMERINILKKST